MSGWKNAWSLMDKIFKGFSSFDWPIVSINKSTCVNDWELFNVNALFSLILIFFPPVLLPFLLVLFCISSSMYVYIRWAIMQEALSLGDNEESIHKSVVFDWKTNWRWMAMRRGKKRQKGWVSVEDQEWLKKSGVPGEWDRGWKSWKKRERKKESVKKV